MTMHRSGMRGSALVEFAIAGIPTILLIITTVEMARGMWTYHTLAYGTKEIARFLAVRGADCATKGNACTATVSQIVDQMKNAGLGLDPDKLNVTLWTITSKQECIPLSKCESIGTPWPTLTTPPDSGSNPGQRLWVEADIKFDSAILMFFPTDGTVSQLGELTFKARSEELIQF